MRTVMIIDDEKEMRKKYKKLLVGKGFRVVEAPSALDTANLLMREGSALDLIILDINLPQIDGREISEIITEYAPNMPIMVSSVHPVGDQKLKVPRAAEYFSKFQSDDTFLRKVKNILGVEETKPAA